MNCLEVRRLLLESPATKLVALQQHLRECPGCSTFATELQRQEYQLKEALNVQVPPRLAERVLLASSLRQRRQWPYALAASVLLAIAAGVSSYFDLRPQTPAVWSEVVLAHVLNERDSLVKDDRISAERLKVALAGFGLTTKGELGHVRFLERCPLPGGKGLHVVIDTHELGRVTLILPPQGTKFEDGRSAREGFAAALINVNDTAIGVVTEHPEQLERLSLWLKAELQSV